MVRYSTKIAMPLILLFTSWLSSNSAVHKCWCFFLKMQQTFCWILYCLITVCYAGVWVKMWQCSCVSQELAEETSESLCMVVVKLDVLQQGKVIVRLLLVGAFTKYWLELQSDHNLLYDYRVQIGLRRRCNILSSSPSCPSKKLMAQSHTLQTPARSAREHTFWSCQTSSFWHFTIVGASFNSNHSMGLRSEEPCTLTSQQQLYRCTKVCLLLCIALCN